MKRFPRASYLRDQLHRLFVTAMLALAALALLGKAAHAQASCGDITDQPEAVYEDMVGVLGEFFPIEDARVRDKIVKAGVAACHKAVSDAESCQGSLLGSTFKAVKSACGTTADPGACIEDAEEQRDATEAGAESLAGDAHGACDGEFEEALRNACLVGFPM